jgi:hypothetical protein
VLLAFQGRLTPVSGEDDVGVLQQMGTEHVRKSMVFFVESEDGAVGRACIYHLDSIGERSCICRGKTYECRRSQNISSRHPRAGKVRICPGGQSLQICNDISMPISTCHYSIPCS